MTSPPRIAIIIGSTRPRRICPEVAEWIRATVREKSRLAYELVDLAEVDLPFLDEPLMPALGGYTHDHTKRWSALVDSFAGFFFVFPQYNWGYPAPLKNALDYLAAEWEGKPASFLTYGTHGGHKAAAQFIEVLHGLEMDVLAHHIEAVVHRHDVNDEWQLVDVAATFAPTADELWTIDVQMDTALGVHDPSRASLP